MTPLHAAALLWMLAPGCDDAEPVDSTAPVSRICADDETAGHTVGLLACEPGAGEGYTLLAPLDSTTTFLIDGRGQVVHTWGSAHAPGSSVTLLDDGSLLRPAVLGTHSTFQKGGTAGGIERISWDGTLLWQHSVRGDDSVSHHDVAPLPDGDVLVLIWEAWTDDQALAAGRDPALLRGEGLWDERVVQFRPTGETTAEEVWSWRASEHLIQDLDPDLPNHGVVADHPEQLDLNPPGSVSPDWIHLNAVDWDPVHDRVVLSALGFSEAWVLDHATTTAEAAGPAGDLVYRWGNPQAYGPYDGPDQTLHGQHDVHWIPAGLPGAGDLLAFDNGAPGPTGPLSQALQIPLPVDDDGTFIDFDGRWGPDAASWAWPDPASEELSSDQLGGAQRLAGGDTLICEGENGRVIQVDDTGAVVWVYASPIVEDQALAQGEVPEFALGVRANALFRATRIPSDHPGLEGRDLAPGPLLEEWVGEFVGR